MWRAIDGGVGTGIHYSTFVANEEHQFSCPEKSGITLRAGLGTMLASLYNRLSSVCYYVSLLSDSKAILDYKKIKGISF